MLRAAGRWLLGRAGLTQAGWEAYLVLHERGELPPQARLEMAVRLRHSLRSAWLGFLARPAAPLLLPALALAFIVLFSRGFSFSRFVLSHGGGLLVIHGLVIVFSLVVGAVILLTGRHALSGRTVRYWLFFVFKTLLLAGAVLLLWVEANGPLWEWVNHGAPWRRLLVLPPCLLCIFLFGVVMLWCLADQRLRCPVCLRRLSLPTSFGSWASVFDPPSTEMFCEAGHGTLNVAARAGAMPDQWTPLDSSWRDLFRV